MERVFFYPYEGKKPYMFISYAHADSAQVLPVITYLKNVPTPPEGDAPVYRIWYDEGIDPGSEWPENIARHLKNAALAVLFLSEAAFRSENCRREIQVAVNIGHPLLCVRLDEAPIPEDIAPLLENHPFVAGKDRSFEQIVSDMLETGAIKEELIGLPKDPPPPPPPPWRLILAIAAVSALIICVAVYLSRSGKSLTEALSGAAELGAVRPQATATLATPTPEPRAVAFQDPKFYQFAVFSLGRQDLMPIAVSSHTLETAIRQELNKPEGAYIGINADLSKITSLYLCGDAVLSSRAEIQVKDGEFYAAGQTVKRGDVSEKMSGKDSGAANMLLSGVSHIFGNGEAADDSGALAIDYEEALALLPSDLGVIGYMTELTELALVNQSITNTKSLESLQKLRYVDLSGNDIPSCLGLLNTDTIEELNIAHTEVTSLQHLLGMDGLRTVYVSADMLEKLYIPFERMQFSVVVID